MHTSVKLLGFIKKQTWLTPSMILHKHNVSNSVLNISYLLKSTLYMIYKLLGIHQAKIMFFNCSNNVLITKGQGITFLAWIPILQMFQSNFELWPFIELLIFIHVYNQISKIKLLINKFLSIITNNNNLQKRKGNRVAALVFQKEFFF